jgi:hypothetical protein
MKRVEAAHRYDVPVDRGFAFITNTANWPRFWPGYVCLEDGSRWSASGDTARLVTRLFGRERELTMTIRSFEPKRLVTYTSFSWRVVSTKAGVQDHVASRNGAGAFEVVVRVGQACRQS